MTLDEETWRSLNLTPLEGEAMRIISNLIDLPAGEDPIQFANDMANGIDDAKLAEACRSLATKMSALRKSVAH